MKRCRDGWSLAFFYFPSYFQLQVIYTSWALFKGRFKISLLNTLNSRHSWAASPLVKSTEDRLLEGVCIPGPGRLVTLLWQKCSQICCREEESREWAPPWSFRSLFWSIPWSIPWTLDVLSYSIQLGTHENCYTSNSWAWHKYLMYILRCMDIVTQAEPLSTRWCVPLDTRWFMYWPDCHLWTVSTLHVESGKWLVMFRHCTTTYIVNYSRYKIIHAHTHI